jgi:hypothetical protein
MHVYMYAYVCLCLYVYVCEDVLRVLVYGIWANACLWDLGQCLCIFIPNALLILQLDAAASRARKNPAPFGGVQVILCGDFLQLPPVAKGDHLSLHLSLRAYCSL